MIVFLFSFICFCPLSHLSLSQMHLVCLKKVTEVNPLVGSEIKEGGWSFASLE